MHVVVIGCGPIGAAAGRHLARAGHRVTLIGPPEPVDRSGPGPFASHYDEGRIARVLDHSPLWARIKGASMARFREIEAASSIGFFTESGGMMGGPANGPLFTAAERVQASLNLPVTRLDEDALARQFPFLRFPSGFAGLWEPVGAGWINPRRLVAAQLGVARSLGAMVIPETVRDIAETGSGVTVATDTRRIGADHAVLAAGAFVRDLTARPLPIQVYARTVLLLRVSRAEAARLSAMPTLVIEAENDREPYLLPPIRYPDGGLWLKIGGDPVDLPLAPADVVPWFHTEGSSEVARCLRDRIEALIPDLAVEATRTEACVVTFTAADLPLVDRLSPHLTIATAGCARGAKGSDEIGRLAAESVAGRGWPELAALTRG